MSESLVKAEVIDSFPSPTPEELREFEIQTGLVLPDQYVAFLLKTNGGSFVNWPADVGTDEVDAIDLLYGFNAPLDFYNLQEQFNDYKLDFYEYRKLRGYLPIGHDPFGGLFCIQAKHRKRSMIYHYQLWDEEFEYKAAASFDEFLDRLYVRSANEEKTPLLHQIERGDYGQVKAILASQNFDFNERSARLGLTPLALASRTGSAKICELLINAGFSVNAKSDSGLTPLHLAGSSDVIRLLVKSGADIDARNKEGFTPFLYKLNKCFDREASTLLELGAKYDAPNVEGKDYKDYIGRNLNTKDVLSRKNLH